MSKKTDVEKLVESALNEDVKNPFDGPVVRVPVSPHRSRPGAYAAAMLALDSVPEVIATPVFVPDYPPTQTDQTHGLSLAQMVAQGQGSVAEADVNMFDFPDGKDLGDDYTVPTMQQLEWADPAERYEAEQGFKKMLQARAVSENAAVRPAQNSPVEPSQTSSVASEPSPTQNNSKDTQ